MKVGIIGCGAIGGLFLGYLSNSNLDVVGIVRDYQKEAVLKDGLIIEGARGKFLINPSVKEGLDEKMDLVIFSTKIQNLEEAVKNNINFLKEAYLLTTQNGVRAECILSEFFPARMILSGIVMFAATFYPPRRVVHNFEGKLILGSMFDEEADILNKVEETIGSSFDIFRHKNIKGAKYLKLLVNLNNCLPAVLGVSMQEAFSDLEVCRLAVRLNREALDIIKKAGIALDDLPGYPKERIENLVSLPENEAAKIFSQVMTSLSKEPLYGSILQSIKRLKRSEIDYINGEISKIAESINEDAPLNKRIVELVHRVEESGNFLSKKELEKSFKEEL